MPRSMLSMESLQEEEDDEDADNNYEDEEEEEEDWEQEQDAAMWRSVLDEASQKTYYYHVVSRESVWDKPLALCSARERAEVARRKDHLRSFFAEMEGNIRTKIGQGLLFGGATPPSMPSTPAGGGFTLSMAMGGTEQEPTAGQRQLQQPAARLCRTISTMDDSVVVAQLCAASPRVVIDSTSCSSPEARDSILLDGSDGGCSSPPVLAPLTPAAVGHAPSSRRAPAWNTPRPAMRANDIPVLRRLVHSGSGGGGGNTCKPCTGRRSPSSEKNGAPGLPSFSSSGADSAASCNNGSNSVQGWPRTTHFRRLSSGSGGSSGTHSAAGELAGAEDFATGVEGIGSGSGGYRFNDVDVYVGTGATAGERGGVQQEAERDEAQWHRHSPPPTIVRRNSTSTIYLAAHDTLSDPDLDATIRCVCAVLRAHVIAAVADAGEDDGGGGGDSGSSSAPRERDGVWYGERQDHRWQGGNLRVFDDPPERESSGSGEMARGGSGVGGGEAAAVVPPLREITAFYRDLYHRTCLKFDSIVLSLIYVERLMKETKGALRPQPWNWKSLIMSALVLSSKVWDDNSMWNRDFSEIFPMFSLGRLNQLEVAILGVLRFNVKVLSSEYAKYYFHLREMCVRGGLSDSHAHIHPLDMNDIKELENMSSKLARDSVGQQARSMKAVSLHSVKDTELLRKVAKSGYACTDERKRQYQPTTTTTTGR